MIAMPANLHTLIRIGPDTRAGKGFTLIEMMVVIAILGILLAIAAPSFTMFFEKFRTKRAAETLGGSLYIAKSEAIKRNQFVRLVITASNSGATWCYGLTTANTCNCTVAVPGAGSCFLDAGVETAVSSTAYKGISVADTDGDPITSMIFSFNPLRGTASANTVQFHSENDYETRTVVDDFGRVRACSPSDNYIGGGYTRC